MNMPVPIAIPELMPMMSSNMRAMPTALLAAWLTLAILSSIFDVSDAKKQKVVWYRWRRLFAWRCTDSSAFDSADGLCLAIRGDCPSIDYSR